MRDVIIGIDASNITGGGAVTHLFNILKYASPEKDNFRQVILWGRHDILSKINHKSWLVKISSDVFHSSYLRRSFWQWKQLGVEAKNQNCNILFIPGGSFLTNFRPIVTMSQNMLPFEKKEILRFSLRLVVKYVLLNIIQSISFRKAEGVIFLTNYAQKKISKSIGKHPSNYTIISHGIDDAFFLNIRKQKDISLYNNNNPFRLIYVSPVAPYKHQWNVVEAVYRIRSMGIHIVLDLIGMPHEPSFSKLQNYICKYDPNNNFVFYHNEIEYEDLPNYYKDSDLCVFASSCENLPNVLLEGMASGLPIASSSFGPMPEILGESAIFFNPDEPISISNAILTLVENPKLRLKLSTETYNKSKNYSWQKCSTKTFEFLVGTTMYSQS